MYGDGLDRPTILFIEEDDDTRFIMKRNLQREGYRVLLAVDEQDALERVGDGHANAHLLLVNLVGKAPEEMLTFGRTVRRHGHYDGWTPLVVMAEKYGKDVEGTDVNVCDNDWITYLEEPNQLNNLLARLLHRH